MNKYFVKYSLTVLKQEVLLYFFQILFFIGDSWNYFVEKCTNICNTCI